MTDEQPVTIKKRKIESSASAGTKASSLQCVVHMERCIRNDAIKPINDANIAAIQKAKQMRQVQESAAMRMDSICLQIPDKFDISIHGIHRLCYQRFTDTSRLRQPKTSQYETCSKASKSALTSSVPKRSLSTSMDRTKTRLFPQNSCIFCKKGPSKRLQEARTHLTHL